MIGKIQIGEYANGIFTQFAPNPMMAFTKREVVHHPITEHSVICNRCGKIYDLTKVEVTHRFHDCTQFTTPCCNSPFADDRVFKNDFTYLKDLVKKNKPQQK